MSQSFWLMLALGAVLVLTRWPLAPRYLYYFDSVNFALALDDFNPSTHQPQPPGYPLFVLYSRALRLVTATPEQTFLLAGILMSALALALIWKTAEQILGRRAGWIATLLLVLNPPFWLAGITTQVRTCLAAGSCAVALLAWRASQPHAPSKWFYGAAAALGIAAGFRPALLLFLLPLLMWAGWRGRRTAREWLIAGIVLAATAGGWLGYTIHASGGPKQFFEVLREYSRTQFSPTSALLGADAPSAWRMMVSAVVWNGLGVLSWIWLLPFARKRPIPQALRDAAPFLLVWFLPAFLFHAFIHVGDPDHTLVTVPVLCILGAAFLADLRQPVAASNRPRTSARLRWAVAAAVMLNAFIFLRPLPGIAKACSYRAVRNLDRTIAANFGSIRELKRARPVAVVMYGSIVTWRHLFYYFPEVPVLLLNPTQNDFGSAWLFRDRRNVPVPVVNGEIVLPTNRRVLWLVRPQPQMHNVLAQNAPVQRHGTVVYLDAKPDMHFEFAGYRFATPPRPDGSVGERTLIANAGGS